MRVVQYELLRGVLDPIELPTYLYAFERGRNVPSMAVKHVKKPLVISIDIKDFFPSVKVDMIAKAFKDMTCLSEEDSKLAAELVTYKYFLPQGGITSPKVSNMIVANTFGEEIKKYCAENRLNLTIYADDVTVSSDVPLEKDKAHEIYTALGLILKKHGFTVKREKTKFMLASSRQTVCGIVVNEKLNLDAHTRKLLRSMVHHLENGLPMKVAGEDVTVASLKGRLSWYAQLGHPNAVELMKRVERFEKLTKEKAGD